MDSATNAARHRAWWEDIGEACAVTGGLYEDESNSLIASAVTVTVTEDTEILTKKQAFAARVTADHCGKNKQGRRQARETKPTRQKSNNTGSQTSSSDQESSKAKISAPSTIYVPHAPVPYPDKYDILNDPILHVVDDDASEVSLDFEETVIKGKLIPIKKVERPSKSKSKAVGPASAIPEPKVGHGNDDGKSKKKEDMEYEGDWAPSTEMKVRLPSSKPKLKKNSTSLWHTKENEHAKPPEQLDATDISIEKTNDGKTSKGAKDLGVDDIQKEWLLLFRRQWIAFVDGIKADTQSNQANASNGVKTSEGAKDLGVDDVKKELLLWFTQQWIAFVDGKKADKQSNQAYAHNVDSTMCTSIVDQADIETAMPDESSTNERDQSEAVREKPVIDEMINHEVTDVSSSSPHYFAPVNLFLAAFTVPETDYLKSKLAKSSSIVPDTLSDDSKISQDASSPCKTKTTQEISSFWLSSLKRRRRRKNSAPPVPRKMPVIIRSDTWEEKEFDRVTISTARFIPDISWRELKHQLTPADDTLEVNNVGEMSL